MAMFMFSRKGQEHRAQDMEIPRAIAYADRRTVALGYLFGTAFAAGVIAEILLRTG